VQLQQIVQVLEQAHIAFPGNEKIIGQLIKIILDNTRSSGIAYTNTKTGQLNYWQLPHEQRSWLKGRYEYYLKQLDALRPGASASFKTPTLREQLERFATPKWISIVAIGLALLVVAIVQNEQSISSRRTALNTPSSAGSENPSTLSNVEFERAGSRLWTDVKLYYGSSKTYFGDVLGGNEHYVDPVTGKKIRGLKIRLADGRLEWKDRNQIVLGDWYVKRNDPAIARTKWFEFDH